MEVRPGCRGSQNRVGADDSYLIFWVGVRHGPRKHIGLAAPGMMTPELLAIFVGGGAGAVCRYGVGRFVGGRYGGDFPLGTFLINISGCFGLGLLSTALTLRGTAAALLLALLGTGFLGGYTTFSTYALEGFLLYQDGSRREALASLLGSVAAGLVAAALGAGVARLLWAA